MTAPNALIALLLDRLDEYTSGDPADDTVVYDRLQLAQELAGELWDWFVLGDFDSMPEPKE